MSTVHVLEKTSLNGWKVVIHTAVPNGNNSAGFSWKNVFLNAKRSGSSILEVGNGPGQITNAENVQVLNGDVLEFVFSNMELESGTSPIDVINQLTPQEISNILTAWQGEFKYWGLTN